VDLTSIHLEHQSASIGCPLEPLAYFSIRLKPTIHFISSWLVANGVYYRSLHVSVNSFVIPTRCFVWWACCVPLT